MSRTIRIKNNYRKFQDAARNEYGVRNIKPWDFHWVNGSEIGRDPDYEYFVAKESSDKTKVWKTNRWYHSDGRANWSLGGPKPNYHFKVRNKADRCYSNRALRILASRGYEDVYLGTKRLVSMNCW